MIAGTMFAGVALLALSGSWAGTLMAAQLLHDEWSRDAEAQRELVELGERTRLGDDVAAFVRGCRETRHLRCYVDARGASASTPSQFGARNWNVEVGARHARVVAVRYGTADNMTPPRGSPPPRGPATVFHERRAGSCRK